MVALLTLLLAAPATHSIRVYAYAAPGVDTAAPKLLAAAEAGLDPTLGVHFVVERVSTFTPDPDPSLDRALVALERNDGGGAADLVVGLLPPRPGVEAHAASRARSPGRHLVVCGDDPAVFLHALRHVLGGVHGTAGSKEDTALLGIGLSHFPDLLSAGYKHDAAAYLKAHFGAFDRGPLTSALTWLETETVVASELPPREATWLKEAKQHADEGKNELAWQALQQLEAHAKQPDVATLACRVAIARQGVAADQTPADTRERCKRAAKRSPTNATAILLRAQTELQAKDAPAAAESIVFAADLIDRFATPPHVYDYFLSLAQNAGCIGLAEAAADNAGGEQRARIRSWAGLARRRAALGVMPAVDECRLQAELSPVLDFGDQKRWSDAEAIARKVLGAHPGSPAPLTLLCEALAQTNRDKDAEPHCKNAITAAPEASVAHYWLGVIAWRRGDKAAAKKSFARVVELDPEAAHAKEMLKRATLATQ